MSIWKFYHGVLYGSIACFECYTILLRHKYPAVIEITVHNKRI